MATTHIGLQRDEILMNGMEMVHNHANGMAGGEIPPGKASTLKEFLQKNSLPLFVKVQRTSSYHLGSNSGYPVRHLNQDELYLHSSAEVSCVLAEELDVDH